MTQVILLGDATLTTVFSWPDPGNWTPFNNTVEIVGAGAKGQNGSDSAGAPGSGSGGGAGAYAKGVNLNPTFPVPYMINPANATTTTYYSVFNGNSHTSQSPAANKVYATCGIVGSWISTAAGGSIFYPAGFKGGDGGVGTPQTPNI